jgi:paired amphipathic helix protein Sin3a
LSRNPNSSWQQQAQQGQGPNDAGYGAHGASISGSVFGQPQQGQASIPQSEAHPSRDHRPSAATVAQQQHQQEQRGVSQLQSAVNVATNGTPGPRGIVIPPLVQTPSGGIAQQTVTSVTTPGPQNQGGMEKRGPVEFNHAISYVNKIKVLPPKLGLAILDDQN